MSGPWEDFQQQPTAAPQVEDAPWQDYAAPAPTAPATAPPPRTMQPNEFEFEVEQALRRGATPEDIQREYGGVVNARTGGPIAFPQPEQLKSAASYYSRGGKEPVQWDRAILAPDGPGGAGASESTNLGAYARGMGDTLLFNFSDELEAFVETGSFSGPEYDAAWQRRQQRRMADDPDFRSAGQFIGTGLSMAAPVGGLGMVGGQGLAKLAGQVGVGAGIGGSMNALAGIGAAGQDNVFGAVPSDFVTGATLGAAAPMLAAGGRKAVQLFGPSGVDASASADVLQGAGLDVNQLRQRAAEYQAATGQGARIADLLTPDEAQRFTGALSRSADARGRVQGEFQAARTDLPENLSGRVEQGGPVQGPEGIRQATRERGDQEFGAFRETPVTLDERDAAFVASSVIPNAPMSRIVNERVGAPIQSRVAAASELETLIRNIESADSPARQRMNAEQLTAALDRITELRRVLDGPLEVAAGDLDLYRRSLGKRARAKPGEGYREVQEDLEELIANQIPEARIAVENYRRGMETAEGAEFGRTVLAPQGAVDFPEQYEALSRPGLEGAALGARSGLFEQAVESPSKSYALARRLEEDLGFRERLRLTLPADEADELAQYAIAQKRGVDAIAALARIPQSRVESLLDSTEEMTDAVVAAGLGAGGAFKANLANQFFRRVPIGRGAADRLAEDLLDPAQRERVFTLLEQAGLPRRGVRELVQGAFIATGVALSTADRVPEGVPAPQETVTMGVPQQ